MIKFLILSILFVISTNAQQQIALGWISEQQANWDVPTCVTAGCEYIKGHQWEVTGGPNGGPAINVASFAFLKPTEVLHRVTNSYINDGVRVGMSHEVVDWYKQHGVMVMFSIGGITYTEDWELALEENAAELGRQAARIAHEYGVGIEIDYEESSSPLLNELHVFITAYRNYIHTDGSNTKYEASMTRPETVLTIDLGQGAQFMGKTANYVALNCFSTDNNQRLLNWVNAMVAGSRPSRISDYVDHWGQHVYGYSTLQTVPIAPAYIVGSVWSAAQRRNILPDCVDYASSDLNDSDLKDFIHTAPACYGSSYSSECKAFLDAPPSGNVYTDGLLGYAYWMMGVISTVRTNTYPDGIEYIVYPDANPPVSVIGDGSCENGVGGAFADYNIPTWPFVPRNY